MIRFALAALVMGSLAIPAAAQQPAPAPTPAADEDILDEIEPPEVQASLDLERLGEEKTRLNATRRLLKALDVVREGELYRTHGYTCKDAEIQALRDAVRYYARAYDLPTNIDVLLEELAMLESATTEGSLARSSEEVKRDWQQRWGPAWGWLRAALVKIRRIKACDAEATSLRVGSADIKGGGLSKGAKIGIAAGAVAVVGVLVAAGGGDAEATGVTPSQPPTSQTPSTPATPPPGALPTGAFSASLVCIRDPGGHDPAIHGGTVNRLDLAGTAAAISFTGPPPWVAVSGTWDPATGRVSATGRGNVAGFPNIRCTFEGTLTPAGELAGDYVVGVGGGLPSGQTTTYQVLGRRN